MDMIEKVADDIFDVIWPAQEWEMSEEVCRSVSRAAAIAAIRATREPTKAMRLAGHKHIPDDHGDPLASAVEVWQAMIDAALPPSNTKEG